MVTGNGQLPKILEQGHDLYEVKLEGKSCEGTWILGGQKAGVAEKNWMKSQYFETEMLSSWLEATNALHRHPSPRIPDSGGPVPSHSLCLSLLGHLPPLFLI